MTSARATLAGLALALCMGCAAAAAPPVAIVTDLEGGAVLQTGGAPRALAILSELADGAEVRLEAGARLVAVSTSSGDEYRFAGPASIRFARGAPQVLSGAAPSARPGPLGKERDLRVPLARTQQAGMLMRGVRVARPIALRAPRAGGVTLQRAPRFAWADAGEGLRYRFELRDAADRRLHAITTPQTALRLPAAMQLEPGEAYRWTVQAQASDGALLKGEGRFRVATPALRAEFERLRPPAQAPVATRVVFALWLEGEQLFDEAAKVWAALSRARPADRNLSLRAGVQ